MHHHFTKLNMKRVLAALLAAVWVLMLCVPVSAVETSGECGTGVNWSYADGTLTVSGDGAMKSYSISRPAPWYDLREEIRVVKVESGVTGVGKYAFYDLPVLASVTLADTVTSVSAYAFANCVSLKMLSLGNGLRTIAENVFENCAALQSVRLPESLTAIGNMAFHHCESLRSITVPAGVTSLGSMVFARCNGLVTAEIDATLETLPLWSFYSCDMLTEITLPGSIRTLGSKAFYLCNNLRRVYYLGDEANGEPILNAIVESLPEFVPERFYYSKSTSSQVEVSGGTADRNALVSESVKVQDSGNASISTVVTKTIPVEGTEEAPYLGEEKTSVQIEAVVENNEGWSELIDQIGQTAQGADAQNSNEAVKVSVALNDETKLSGESLAPIAGQNVSLTVEMKDGSAYSIDCKRLTEDNLSEEYEFTYTLVANREPTEKQTALFGEAISFLLNFTGDSSIDYSPRIYVGKEYARECAVLYQQLKGQKIERVQSAIVDKDGYATFYLGQTLNKVQYFLAIGVKDETYANAVIPDQLSVDGNIIEMYEPIEYVVTGQRIFMGMNVGQFSFFMFGGLFAMFVVIGTVMAIFYRKKRLELMYRLRMQDETE